MADVARPGSLSRRGFLGAVAGLGAAGLSVGGLGAAGCTPGGGALGDRTGELVLWTWPDNDKVFAETLVGFEKKFPDIKVKVQGFDPGSYSTKLLGALVSGTGPDVAMVEITYISNFKSKPGFVDLGAPPFNAGELIENYADFTQEYVTNSASGSVFALPKNTGPGGMFFRRDVFDEVGLPTESGEVHEAMRTWDSYMDVGKEVLKEDERWLIDDPAAVVGAVRNQYGISYFDEQGRPQFLSDEMLIALEMIPRLRHSGLLAPQMSEQERGAAINAGRVATFFSGNWFGGWLKNTYAPEAAGKWGVALAPETDGNAAFNAGGDFIGILRTSEKQLAAWELIKWITQDSESLKGMYAKDLYPAWGPALEEPWINAKDPYYGGQNVNQVFSEVSETMQTPVTNPNDAIANTALTTAVTDVQNGIRTPEQALKRAQAEVESKMV